ncbi:MAG: hypothetical protein K6T61_10430 [Bryobacteraceae bacterium]|nr:hypothetical protein [Bryobacteraceae bacterium]
MSNATGKSGISRRIIVWAVSYLVIFLLGFVPQYGKARSARRQLESVRQELAAAGYRLELAALRDGISQVHLEAVQKNYGIAAQRSTAFFDQLQGMANRERDAERKKAFQEILAARDTVTAGLAGGDPAVTAEIQRLLRLLFTATGV